MKILLIIILCSLSVYANEALQLSGLQITSSQNFCRAESGDFVKCPDMVVNTEDIPDIYPLEQKLIIKLHAFMECDGKRIYSSVQQVPYKFREHILNVYVAGRGQDDGSRCEDYLDSPGEFTVSVPVGTMQGERVIYIPNTAADGEQLVIRFKVEHKNDSYLISNLRYGYESIRR